MLYVSEFGKSMYIVMASYHGTIFTKKEFYYCEIAKDNSYAVLLSELIIVSYIPLLSIQ